MATMLDMVAGMAAAALRLGRRPEGSSGNGRPGGASAGGVGMGGGSGPWRSEPPSSREAHTPYVRLTAEDSARLERLDGLMERLIALEEHHQATTERLAQLVIDARVEQATRHGEFVGLLRARG